MRVGVIGIGYWGKKVAREYIDLYEEGFIDSIALCDIDESKLEPFKEQVKTYSKIDEFIRAIDAVHICTNNQTHYDIAKAALMNETNVLVEKPMTMNHDQAYSLVEIASEHGLVLQVGHIFRFANVIRKVKELYKEGFFGDIRYVKLEWTSLMPPIKDLDIIWDLLPHPLDIINFVTGEWPTEFRVTGRAYRREKLSEVAFIQADYNNDFFANIAISWLQPIRRRTMEIVGSRRSAIVDCVGQELEVYEEGGSKNRIEVVPNNTIRDEAFNFLNAIKTGKNTFNSAIVGARCVEMIERAIERQKVMLIKG